MVWKCLQPHHPGTAQTDGNSAGAPGEQTDGHQEGRGASWGNTDTQSPVTAPTPSICLILTWSQEAGSFGVVVVVQSFSRVRLCDPMDCSTLGFPVHHQLLELAQTHVHQVGDAIQPFHPLSSPSPPPPNPSQHQGLFQ